VQRAFLDYYAALGRSPVSQDITDLQRHLERRTSLYRSLGIPPRFFGLAEVLEFGPGLGHNAVHVAMLQPRRHVLVDASTSGLEGLRATLRSQFGDLDRFEIVEALAQEYRDDRTFDIVLAENMIPMQRDPIPFCRAIASHVKPGGVLVVTCMDAVSFMGETLRRVIALKLAPPSLSVEERVARLRDLFGSHLAQLPGVSRPADDWIKDNVTHPLFGDFFSIGDAIEAVGDEFDYYGGSPQFETDWRWYKQLHGDNRRFNDLALEAYRANVVNLMDWRILVSPQSPELGERLLRSCGRLWRDLREVEEGKRSFEGDAFARICDEIAAEIAAVAHRTAASVREVGRFLGSETNARPEEQLAEFASYFGRGTQYVSFIRR
jgi:SAM-dependent methyltransferase